MHFTPAQLITHCISLARMRPLKKVNIMLLHDVPSSATEAARG